MSMILMVGTVIDDCTWCMVNKPLKYSSTSPFDSLIWTKSDDGRSSKIVLSGWNEIMSAYAELGEPLHWSWSSLYCIMRISVLYIGCESVGTIHVDYSCELLMDVSFEQRQYGAT